MIKVGIAGATGYTGQELVRILSTHRQVRLEALWSSTSSGSSYSSVLPGFLNRVDAVLHPLEQFQALAPQCDVVFLALPHGLSSRLINEDLLRQVKVIDLGAQFRLKDPLLYQQWYHEPHCCQQLLEKAIYGLPELHRDVISSAGLVANPGCYATAIILGLLPLVEAGLLKEQAVIVDGKSGVSGAGRALSSELLFNECNENLKAYKPGVHRHTAEVEQELSAIGDSKFQMTFTPHLVPMSRGILITSYAAIKPGVSGSDLVDIYKCKFQNEPFVAIIEGPSPETRWMTGSNQCHISVNLDERTGNAIVISALDNLGKGAAGQAVQNMNIMFGMEETCGLLPDAAVPVAVNSVAPANCKLPIEQGVSAW